MKFLILLAFVCACKDSGKTSPKELNPRIEGTVSRDTSQGEDNKLLLEQAATEKDGSQVGELENINDQENGDSQSIEGKYIRINNEERNTFCDCSCIDISFNHPTELCISPDRVYISARFESTTGNKIEIFLVEVSRTDEEQEIPWSDFDKDTPIATIEPQPDNSLKLDWTGFTIDGEIAVDYALFGKKTLEGTYKRDSS